MSKKKALDALAKKNAEIAVHNNEIAVHNKGARHVK